MKKKKDILPIAFLVLTLCFFSKIKTEENIGAKDIQHKSIGTAKTSKAFGTQKSLFKSILKQNQSDIANKNPVIQLEQATRAKPTPTPANTPDSTPTAVSDHIPTPTSIAEPITGPVLTPTPTPANTPDATPTAISDHIPTPTIAEPITSPVLTPTPTPANTPDATPTAVSDHIPTPTIAEPITSPVLTPTPTPANTPDATAKKRKAAKPKHKVGTSTKKPSSQEQITKKKDNAKPTPTPSKAQKVIHKPVPKETSKPDMKIIKKPKRHARRRVRKTFSMADTPKTLQEKELVAKEISAKPPIIAEQAPDLELQIVKKEDLEMQKDVYLGNYLDPWKDVDPNETVQMNFENKEITELLKFLENNLKITFILDDNVGPKRTEGLKPIAGTKITFKSHTPITFKEAWELGLTFLEMAGFSVIPTTIERTYHVTANAAKDKPSANSQPLPTFIGTDPDLIPDSDAKIRYVYFIQNAELETISSILETLRSGSSGPLLKFPELRAVVMVDKAANIKSNLKIIQEIDIVDTPETLAIINLVHADATEVQKLYQDLIGKDTKSAAFPFRQRKQPTTHYFTENTRVFAEPRMNRLIILGTRDNIKKFEDFISRYIDRKPNLPYSPLHIYPLLYIDANSTAKILNDIISGFNSDTTKKEAVAVGGVRDGNKFFTPNVKITAEPSGNRLIINASYEEYLKLRDVLERLDVEQPQVAIKVLVLDVDLTNFTDFGTQIRNSKACCDGTGGTDSILGQNINFQYAGLNGFVTREKVGTAQTTVTGAERLLGNLINLAAAPSSGPGLFSTGTTLVTLGKDIFGFWGLLRILEQITRVSVVANPFLVTTHKYPAEITVGETRRVLSAIITSQGQSQPAFSNLDANLSIKITPLISYDDMVTLNIYVEVAQFTEGGELPTILRKQITTEALVANREVIALGGLIRDAISETVTKVPILGDIPLIGWLFKNKNKTLDRTSLLILISPEIIKPHEPDVAEKFTEYKINDAKETFYSMEHNVEKRDPIHRWLFYDHKEKEISEIDKFASRQSRYVSASQKKRLKPILAMDEKNKNKKKSLLEIIDHENQEQQGTLT